MTHNRMTRTLLGLLTLTLTLVLALSAPAGATTARRDPPPGPFKSQPRFKGDIIPIVVKTGPGYAIVADALTLQVSIVLDRGNSNGLLWVLASDGCSIDCVRWVLVSQANRVPTSYTACMSIWPYWCKTFNNIRVNFIHDATYRDDLYNAVVRASYIYGDCVEYGIWPNRYWSHTNDACVDKR
jgi:hypothetical protein